MAVSASRAVHLEELVQRVRDRPPARTIALAEGTHAHGDYPFAGRRPGSPP